MFQSCSYFNEQKEYLMSGRRCTRYNVKEALTYVQNLDQETCKRRQELLAIYKSICQNNL